MRREGQAQMEGSHFKMVQQQQECQKHQAQEVSEVFVLNTFLSTDKPQARQMSQTLLPPYGLGTSLDLFLAGHVSCELFFSGVLVPIFQWVDRADAQGA